jgi:hypothetical protein
MPRRGPGEDTEIHQEDDMAEDKEKVKVLLPYEGDSEDVFFKENDQKLIQALREKAAKEADSKYREEHKGHCFRCGTKSLAEIKRGNVTIDVCINKGCGAVHLDPGELESCEAELKKQDGGFSKITGALGSLFK